MTAARLVVIGGGVTGLAGARAAVRAARAVDFPLRVTVLEAASRLGGLVLTESDDGVPVDLGADAFTTSRPWFRELVSELGLDAEVAEPVTRRAYILLAGRLRPLPRGLSFGVPLGPSALIDAAREGILDAASALRAGLEPVLPGIPSSELSAGELARMRLGPRASARLVEPGVAGAFGAPADAIGARLVFPGLPGAPSLSAAARRGRDRVGPLTLRGGLGVVIERLAAALDASDIRTGRAAVAIVRRDDTFVVSTSAGDEEGDAVLVATPAPTAAELLRTVAPSATGALHPIRYIASAIAYMRWPVGSLARPLDASGYVAAADEDTIVASCSWLTARWPHMRADATPRLRALVTSPQHLGLDDDALLARVCDEVGRVMGAAGPPSAARLKRWDRAVPAFAPGHAEQLVGLDESLPGRLALAGSALGLYGLADGVRTGEEAGVRLVARLLVEDRLARHGRSSAPP